jgi:deoxyribodipyrimidine photo-lyase
VCPLNNNCPIQNFPDEALLTEAAHDPLLDHDPDVAATAGPAAPVVMKKPDYVMLTIDSLGDRDAALSAHPNLPVVFVFNEDGLRKLQLSSRRIAFYLETLQDLSTRRDLHVYLGDPYRFAAENSVAVTFAPVPSFRKFTGLAEIHPYPWFRKPHSGSVRSFSSWRRV